MAHFDLRYRHAVTGDERVIRYDVKPEDSCWVHNCPHPVTGVMEVLRDARLELACREHATRGEYHDGA